MKCLCPEALAGLTMRITPEQPPFDAVPEIPVLGVTRIKLVAEPPVAVTVDPSTVIAAGV